MTRKTYWHKHPRNFSNECSAVVASTAAEREDCRTRGYAQLSRAEMRRHLTWVNYGDIKIGDLPPLWREEGE